MKRNTTSTGCALCRRAAALGANAAAALTGDEVVKLTDPRRLGRPSGDYAGTRHNKLTDIQQDNARNLQMAWSMSTGGPRRGHEGQPLVSQHDVLRQRLRTTSGRSTCVRAGHLPRRVITRPNGTSTRSPSPAAAVNRWLAAMPTAGRVQRARRPADRARHKTARRHGRSSVMPSRRARPRRPRR